MTNKDRILTVLTTKEMCDDCLSEQSGVHPRQIVYAICRSLSRQSFITRNHEKCELCSKLKLVSRLLLDESKMEVEPIKSIKLEQKRTTNWYWKRNVIARVVGYLAKNGYYIHSVSKTASHTSGKDIVATTPDGDEIWVMVKGYPEKSNEVQARHWFSQAFFDLVLYHGENPSAKLAVALPDGFATYLNLLPRIKWLKETMPFDVIWVANDGKVRTE